MQTTERKTSKKTHSLLELTQSIKLQMEKTYRSAYWIKAEINKLNYYPQSGHCYPELVEKSNGKIVTEIRGFVFRNVYEEIHQNFKTLTGKPLADGMEVLLLCRVSYDPKYGLSLYITDIDPAYTLGEMARLRSEAIERLRKEGILHANKDKPLPKLVTRLAVISVETSKGWRDFSQTVEDSKYGHLIVTSLFPARLQGDVAVESIANALHKISNRSAGFDAVAIIRGGGGESGMDCYDSYQLAKTVATFPIPVLTGIGHSTNLTVVEQCGYKNLITPTALGQFLLNGFIDFEDRLDKATLSLRRLDKQVLPLLRNRLDGAQDRLGRTAKDKLDEGQNKLRMRGWKLETLVRNGLADQVNTVQYKMPFKLTQSMEKLMHQKATATKTCAEKLRSSAPQYCLEGKKDLNHFAEKLRLLDPQNVLKRGYSITIKDGKALTSVKNLKDGDEVVTRLASGEFASTIKNLKNG